MTAVGGSMTPPSNSSVMTASGRYFDPLNPTAGTVHLPDVARGLERSLRFNGQLIDPQRCPHPQSLASHSCRVGRLCFVRASGWLPSSPVKSSAPIDPFTVAAVTLAGLIHDSPEGYVGDCLGPIKTHHRKQMETEILASIAETLVGDSLALTLRDLVNKHSTVAWADNVALIQEALLYQPGSIDWTLREQISAWTLADRMDTDDLTVSGVQMRLDVADTLHLFHPREGESWLRLTQAVARIVREGDSTECTIDQLGQVLGV